MFEHTASTTVFLDLQFSVNIMIRMTVEFVDVESQLKITFPIFIVIFNRHYYTRYFWDVILLFQKEKPTLNEKLVRFTSGMIRYFKKMMKIWFLFVCYFTSQIENQGSLFDKNIVIASVERTHKMKKRTNERTNEVDAK